MPVLQLYLEHGVRQSFNDSTFEFEDVFAFVLQIRSLFG